MHADLNYVSTLLFSIYTCAFQSPVIHVRTHKWAEGIFSFSTLGVNSSRGIKTKWTVSAHVTTFTRVKSKKKKINLGLFD